MEVVRYVRECWRVFDRVRYVKMQIVLRHTVSNTQVTPILKRLWVFIFTLYIYISIY